MFTSLFAAWSTVFVSSLLQGEAPLSTILSSFEARAAASVVLTITVAVIWRLLARLHDRDIDAISSPVWHLGVTLLRLVVAIGGGSLLVVIWPTSAEFSAISEQYGLGTETLARLALSMILAVGAYVLTTVIGRFIREIASTRPEISDHQREIIYRLTQVTTYLVALVGILGVWNANLGGILVGAGFLGIVVGMAARQTLGALLAGFVLMFSRPFEIGDWVEVGNHEGIVTEITVVNTRIQTFDGEYVMIPNDVVSSESLVNRSRKGRLRLDVEVGVDYGTDLERAATVAQEAVEDLDEVLSVPKPQVVAKRFADSAVVLGVRPWIDRPSARRKWRAQTAVISTIHEEFQSEGITIPFPQRELSSRERTGPVRLTEPAESPAERNGQQSDGQKADERKADDQKPDTSAEQADANPEDSR
ncbi:mechanosensitive ion channel family protein [Haloferax larsenii]|uniref:Mechanosensitive ion channel family protein n=1 Tax=Haloferax larsenii TaxID=302484 RepID=A0ABY5RCR7_HALLR|nr:mechanosensitive ion channel family protein [Haloferax larsenii]ELZ78573.1 mechanosensitive ion channel protein MscS [Haloferax larsenii JCM 13917]UVE50159.1 mechanosensitive ion channel family protein [Haloferax larsenii]